MNLQEQLALALANAKSAYEAGNIEEGDKHKADAERLSKAVKALADLTGIEDSTKSIIRPNLPGQGNGTVPQSPAKATQDEPTDNKATKAIYSLRFGDESSAKAAILTDLVGSDYQQRIWDQGAAFAKYLRGGEYALERAERKALEMQVFPFETIEQMVKSGYSIAEIKSTMVEAQGTLGGFAVPATMQSAIIQRMPGLTAVRGSGATVINLTTGNSTEYVEITGGGDQYVSGLRGSWGTETQTPTSKNYTLGTKTITADVYTYKVPMSQSLVEDASNLVTVLQNLATTTMAMDEDDACLIGDGAGKPRGILPGSTNALGLAYVASGAASTLKANGIKSLKRGIAVQYRQSAVMIANSDTFLDIELLVDGQGQYLFPDLTDEAQLLRRRKYESESMPDVNTNTFPIIFGDMSGYTIVERSGMTIARYQDSNTGPNLVEFHFRRRVGGRVTEPWKFCVQKVATS